MAIGSTLFAVKPVKANVKKINNFTMLYMQKIEVLEILTVVYL